jgi:hypothetical protein
VSRGDNHYSRIHPEKLARGDRNGRHTHPERTARGDRQGRHTHPESYLGEKKCNAKLTTSQVKEIRNVYDKENFTHKEMSQKYNISPTQIGRIIRYESWSHIK